ncbi:tyrosine/serine/threonine protein phosphatase [Orobanche gracilis]
MAAVLFSNPTISSSLYGRPLSIRGNSKKCMPYCFSFRSPICSLDTPYEGGISKFPRIRVWNPYKRLGITTDASEEEIWGARNFLLNQYAGHERSAESIEASFEKLLMTSFRNRKRTKINLKTKLKKKVEESPPWVKNFLSFIEVPPHVIILRRLFLFAFMACWSVMNPAEAGPAFQGEHIIITVVEH